MPELPEVESVVRALNQELNGQKIVDVIVNYEKILKNAGPKKSFVEKMIGNHFLHVQRRAKFLVFQLDNNEFLVNHLRMEGKWYFEKAESSFDEKHVLLRFVLDDGHELRYHDTRRFGTFDFKDQNSLNTTNPLMKLGYEPFDSRLTVEYLREIAAKKNVSLKAFLLDQRYIVGIGNIYDCEICFDAQIRPEKVVKYLTDDEWKRIIAATRKILDEAIGFGGTTISTFHPSKNVDGTYFEKLKVYGRAKKSCYVCGKEILKIKQNNRGTYYCGQCQKF
jgi:formamidopyrimidine-DNA glycosylase